MAEAGGTVWYQACMHRNGAQDTKDAEVIVNLRLVACDERGEAAVGDREDVSEEREYVS